MTYYVKDMKTLEVREYNTYDEAKNGAKCLANSTGHTIKGFKRQLASGLLTDYAFVYERTLPTKTRLNGGSNE
jgi:hypothetical protein